MKDWTQPPFSETPGDLSAALAGAQLLSMENLRAERTVRLHLEVPPDAGPMNVTFEIASMTHLLAFAYLAPVVAVPEGLSPEEAVAFVGSYAREGLIQTFDPSALIALGTPLIVTSIKLHATDEAATLTLEGYGEEAETIVWWEIRASGFSVESRASEPAS